MYCWDLSPNPLGNPLADFACAQAPAYICSQLAFANCSEHTLLYAIGFLLQAQVLEQHGCRQDCTNRIGGILCQKVSA